MRLSGKRAYLGALVLGPPDGGDPSTVTVANGRPMTGVPRLPAAPVRVVAFGSREGLDVDTLLDAEMRQMVAPETGSLGSARLRAGDAGDGPPPEIGALLRWAARTAGARHVVEIGSACGISALWLLRGMPPRSVLTSVEHDGERHRLATSAHEEAGVSERIRCILGDPLEVLPRLSDGGYELCLIQGRATDYIACLGHARRLLAPGGWLVARRVLPSPGDDPAERDQAAVLRRFVRDLVEDPRFTATVLPCDGGVALATLNQPEE